MSSHPFRALRRRARALRGRAAPSPRYDSWLEHFYGDRLGRIEAACRDAGPEAFALFRDLEPELWALLLTQEYDAYPSIRALLPDMPDARLQQRWNGASGAALAGQGAAFYAKVCKRYAEHSGRRLVESRVLDFGCGWGRLTRFFARDVAPGSLYGCDPVEGILDECRRNRVPAILGRTEFVPDSLPFDETFDLALAFSVFTHLSEHAHEACLRALHASMNPGGILVLTVRPPEYLMFCATMHPLLESLGGECPVRPDEARYLFVAHATDGHHQYAGGEMTYGETVVTLPYVRERWSERFELLDVDLLIGDPYQVMLTLRRR